MIKREYRNVYLWPWDVLENPNDRFTIIKVEKYFNKYNHSFIIYKFQDDTFKHILEFDFEQLFNKLLF